MTATRSIVSVLAILALVAIATAPALAANPEEFAEAQARADKYLSDMSPGIMKYRYGSLLSKVIEIAPAVAECRAIAKPPAGFSFTAILSFRDGRFDRVLNDSDAPFAQCVTEALGKIDWPSPPVLDFAHELSFSTPESQ